MNIFKDDELIYVNDSKNGINSCGYNVNSLLFNSGISPILTINQKQNVKTSISSLFNNLVVPNWALHYEPNKSKYISKNEDESVLEIVDDNLYEKLMDLAIYKDPLHTIQTAINTTKHKITKHNKQKNKNKIKKKHKKTHKK
jgi:hypothetical protein